MIRVTVKARRAAANVTKECSIDVNAPPRCERYALELYSRNIGGRSSTETTLSVPAPNRLVVEGWLGAELPRWEFS